MNNEFLIEFLAVLIAFYLMERFSYAICKLILENENNSYISKCIKLFIFPLILTLIYFFELR